MCNNSVNREHGLKAWLVFNWQRALFFHANTILPYWHSTLPMHLVLTWFTQQQSCAVLSLDTVECFLIFFKPWNKFHMKSCCAICQICQAVCAWEWKKHRRFAKQAIEMLWWYECMKSKFILFPAFWRVSNKTTLNTAVRIWQMSDQKWWI